MASTLLMGLLERCALALAGVFDWLPRVARWSDADQGAVFDADECGEVRYAAGCYNRVVVVGKYAIRVCRDPRADPSWEWVRYCYEAKDPTLLKVYAMGQLFGFTWAVVENLPNHSNQLEDHLWVEGTGNNLVVLRGRTRYSSGVVVGGLTKHLRRAYAMAEGVHDGVCLDLHTGNYRGRADGTTIITDPFC